MPSKANLGQDIARFLTQTRQGITLPSVTITRVTHEPLGILVIYLHAPTVPPSSRG